MPNKRQVITWTNGVLIGRMYSSLGFNALAHVGLVKYVNEHGQHWFM